MNLIIEVTRKCNMACPHCLRGDAQNKNIKLEYITSLLEQIKDLSINYNVVFTGGEPSLNINALSHYIKECKRLDLKHEYFYMATNGNGNNNINFIVQLMELYALCYEREMACVECSNDEFHEYNYNNDDLINALSFYRKKFKNDYQSIDSRNLIHEGRAWDGSYYEVPSIDDFDNFDDFLCETETYLNCNGNIVNGCNWSYESQNNTNNILCHVNDFKEFFNKHDKGEQT